MVLALLSKIFGLNTGSARPHLHAGLSMVPVGITEDALQRHADGFPAGTFYEADGSDVEVLSGGGFGVKRVEFRDGRIGYVPSEWVAY